MLSELPNIGRIIQAPLNWMEQLLEASTSMGILLSAITLVLAIRFIILPLTGGVIAKGQDRVNAKKGRGIYAEHETKYRSGGKTRTVYRQRKK